MMLKALILRVDFFFVAHQQFIFKGELVLLQCVCVCLVCRSNAALEEQRSRKREKKWRTSSRISERPRQVSSNMYSSVTMNKCVCAVRLRCVCLFSTETQGGNCP